MDADRAAELYLRFAAGMRALTDRVPRILDDPQAYQQEAMLLAIVAALVVVFVVAFVITVYDTVAVAIERRRIGLHATRRGFLRRTAIGGAIVAAVLLVASIAPMSATVASRACTSCHAVEAAGESWRLGTHARASCYACHARPGVLGAMTASIAGVGNLAAPQRAVAADEATLTLAPAPPIYADSCLRCHGALRSGIVGRGVTMRHSDVIEANVACQTCHPGVGHAQLELAPIASTSLVRRSRMSICLTCHDDREAPSACETCHGGRPLDAATAVATPGQVLAPVTCRGCHSAELDRECVACHGLELPHPQPAFRREHTTMSYRDPALCTRCHEEASATVVCACHSQESLHGEFSEWIARHGAAARSTGPGGCNCHSPPRECLKCHERSPF